MQEGSRKLAIRVRRGASRSPDTGPVALGSGQPAISPGMDLGREGQHGQGQHPKHRGTGCHRLAGVGFPRRNAPVSAVSLDGSGQLVGWVDSSTQVSSNKARARPRHRLALPEHDPAMIIAGHMPQLSLTASEPKRTARHSLGEGINAYAHSGATVIG